MGKRGQPADDPPVILVGQDSEYQNEFSVLEFFQGFGEYRCTGRIVGPVEKDRWVFCNNFQPACPTNGRKAEPDRFIADFKTLCREEFPKRPEPGRRFPAGEALSGTEPNPPVQGPGHEN